MKKSVLMVDDDKLLLEAMSRRFHKAPFRLVTASSAEEALALLDGLKFELIVVDQKMPGMFGSDLIPEVMKRSPQVVAIMLTGCPTLEVALDAINICHVFRFLTKPCSEHTLGQAMLEGLVWQESRRGAHVQDNPSQSHDSAHEALEKEFPGITTVQRDSRGRVVI